jgi:hypothetical protein
MRILAPFQQPELSLKNPYILLSLFIAFLELYTISTYVTIYQFSCMLKRPVQFRTDLFLFYELDTCELFSLLCLYPYPI